MTDPIGAGTMLHRRHAVQLMLMVSTGGALAPFVSANAESGIPRFNHLGDELIAFMKLQSRSDDGYTDYFNSGTVYATFPGRQSFALYLYEGLLRFHTKLLSLRLYEVTFIEAGTYCNINTGERLDRFENPMTGAINMVKHVVEGPMTWRWTTENLNVKDPMPILQRRVEWQHFNGQSWLHFDNMISGSDPGSTGRFPAALATYVGSTREIEDKRRTSVAETTLIDSSINPWASWLDMGDAPGRLVNNITGRKLGATSEAPERLIKFIANTHPAVLEGVEAWNDPTLTDQRNRY